MQGAFQIPVSFDTGTNKIVVGDGDDYEPLSLPAYTGGDASLVTAVSDPLTGGIRNSVGSAYGVSAERYYTKSSGDIVGGAGALNGQLTDTGQVWVTAGAGYLTTVVNGDHIEGAQNTYCHIDTGSKIAKAVQYYSGPMATVEIGLNSNLTDMIHANFSSAGLAVITYWKTGVGASQNPQWYVNLANCTNINDGAPHKCELHVSGCFALAYCDGVLCGIAYDVNFPSITGDWMFAQIHGAGDKIYGVESYFGSTNADADAPSAMLEALLAKVIACNGLIVGNPAGAGFSPTSSSYLWTEDPDGHVFGSATQSIVKAKSASAGYSAKICAVAAIGTETGVVSGNDGVGSIQHQGTDKIKFPFNTPRTDIQTPITLPAYTVAALPSAATAYQRTFVSDATSPVFGSTVVGGGAVKVPVYSDGTSWKVG